jgi:hypothetical protein
VQQREEALDLESGTEIQEFVSKAYYDWWEDKKNNNIDEFQKYWPTLRFRV